MIRKNNMIQIPALALGLDEKHFESALKFDGFRAYRQREQLKGSAESGREQFVSVSERAMHFGYGRHSCPGRFFAAVEIKVVLASILLKYDIRMPEDADVKRYANAVIDGHIMPDQSKKLLFKRQGS